MPAKGERPPSELLSCITSYGSCLGPKSPDAAPPGQRASQTLEDEVKIFCCSLAQVDLVLVHWDSFSSLAKKTYCSWQGDLTLGGSASGQPRVCGF